MRYNKNMKKLQSWGLPAVYLANLLLAFHWYTILYINSSFVSGFVGEARIGLMYTIGSVLNLFFLFSAPNILKRIGAYRFIVVSTILEACAVVGLALATTPEVVVGLFILHQGIVPMILFSLDIFLEKYTRNENKTGGIRGIFLTLANVALVVSPILASLVLTNGSYSKVYLLSSLFLIPLLAVSFAWKQGAKEPLQNTRIFTSWKALRKNKNILAIWKSNFLLQIFYACMVIYLPLYLHEHIGFSWQEIASILTIMFLPFLLFEFPVGYLADKKLGEKEILSLGFIIAGISTALIATLEAPLILVWALVLFSTRIGASFIEITSESYFFKQVKTHDTDLISLFRMTRPLSFIVAPFIVSFLLPHISYGILFGLLGIMMLIGLRYSLIIKDTR